MLQLQQRLLTSQEQLAVAKKLRNTATVANANNQQLPNTESTQSPTAALCHASELSSAAWPQFGHTPALVSEQQQNLC
jgi:hypothetical protein